MFLPIRQLVLYAARRIASDPRVRAKAAEVLETEIKPRAKAAWRQTKPKIEAAAAAGVRGYLFNGGNLFDKVKAIVAE